MPQKTRDTTKLAQPWWNLGETSVKPWWNLGRTLVQSTFWLKTAVGEKRTEQWWNFTSVPEARCVERPSVEIKTFKKMCFDALLVFHGWTVNPSCQTMGLLVRCTSEEFANAWITRSVNQCQGFFTQIKFEVHMLSQSHHLLLKQSIFLSNSCVWMAAPHCPLRLPAGWRLNHTISTR